MAAAVRSTSSPVRRPVIRVSPIARAPNIRARWLIDLSPGMAIRPDKGAAARWLAKGRRAGWSMTPGSSRGMGADMFLPIQDWASPGRVSVV